MKGIDPERFERIAYLERGLGTTIRNGKTVEEMARRVKEFVLGNSVELRRLAT